MSADVQKLREKLAWVRKFIEYARYELQPGEQQFGDQFPRQDAADKAMAEIDTVIAALAVLGDPPVAEQEKEATNQPDPTCEHGVAWDVHCCGCHSGFLFDSRKCVCF
jgi:hypothetical protein